MYLRYVVGSDKEDHRHLTGVVTEAALAKKEGLFADYEIETLEHTQKIIGKIHRRG